MSNKKELIHDVDIPQSVSNEFNIHGSIGRVETTTLKDYKNDPKNKDHILIGSVVDNQYPGLRVRTSKGSEIKIHSGLKSSSTIDPDLKLAEKIIIAMNHNCKLNHYNEIDFVKYHLISGKELLNIVKEVLEDSL